MQRVDFPPSNRSSQRFETLITLVDESLSMEERDWHPTRLDGAIEANTELINEKAKSTPHDFVGIIGFSGHARMIHPVAVVGEQTSSLLRSLKDLSLDASTNFKAALELAGACLLGSAAVRQQKPFRTMLSRLLFETDSEPPPEPQSLSQLRIILLTDGDHNEGGSPLKTADHLKGTGVFIECIGIGGTPKAVNESLLKKIASVDASGRPRSRFNGDKDQLVKEYQSLAHHIRTA